MKLPRHATLLPFALLAACTGVYSDPVETRLKQEQASRVFVTSAVYQGGLLGGLDGADEKCMEHASAAGLDGTFKAWLSDEKTSAADRLAHGDQPYKLVDGTTVIANNWDDLVHADLRHVIDRDENGNLLDPPTDLMFGASVWTGSDFDGLPYIDMFDVAWSCGGWSDLHGTGLTGDRAQTTAAWSVRLGLPCTLKAALYCLEQ